MMADIRGVKPMSGNNNANKNSNGTYHIGTFEIVLIVLGIIGFIGLVSDIKGAVKESGKNKCLHYGCDNYAMDDSIYCYYHKSGGSGYSSGSKKSSGSSSSSSKSSGSSSSKSSSSYSSGSSSSSSSSKKSSYTVEPDDHDIEAYYEDYREEFEDEDDAWDDFEDNEEYWDDY